MGSRNAFGFGEANHLMSLRLRDPAAGHLAALVGMAGITAAGCALRSHINEMTVALAMLLVVLSVAAVWELLPALVASVVGVLCLNYFFLPPIYTFTIADSRNWIALAAFFITALVAGQLSRWAKLRAAEAEASRSQARLASAYNRSLLEATLDPLIAVGGDGRINDLNAAAETVTGRSRLELIGSDFAELFTEPVTAREARARVFRDGSVRGYALEISHRNGHSTSLLLDGSLYHDEFGTVIGVVAALHPLGTYVGETPEMRPDPMVTGHLKVLVNFAALFAIAAGALSIIGILLRISWLKTVTPSGPVIKMNTCLCLVLLGLSLWLKRERKTGPAGSLLAGATALIGFLSLVEHVFNWNPGIDQLLFHEAASEAIVPGHPGLISLIAAVNSTLLGLALIMLDRDLPRNSGRYWPAQFLAGFTAIYSTFGVLGFLLGSPTSYTHISLQAAVTQLLVSIGVLLVRTDRGAARLLASSTEGGALTRRLIPGSIVIPIVIGALALKAFSAHMTTEWGSVSLIVVTMIVLLSAFSVWNGYIVNEGDLDRERAEAILQRRQVEMREAERLAHAGSWWRDLKTNCVTWSAGLSQIAGRDPLLPPPSWKEHLGFWTSESVKRLDAAVEKAIATGAPFELELEMVRTDGAVRQIAERGESERDADGQIVLVRGTVQDITERKLAEDAIRMLALRQSVVAELGQQALRSKQTEKVLDEAVLQAAQVLGIDNARVLELLPGGTALLLRAGFGWSSGLIGSATVSAGPETQAGFTLASKQPVIVEDLRTEKRFSSVPMFGEPDIISGMSVIISAAEGPYGVFSVHTRQQRRFTKDEVSFLQSIANVLGTMIERQRAEESLRKSAEEIQDLYNRAPCGYHSLDKDGVFVRINDTELEWLQYTREEVIGKMRFTDVITPEGLKIFGVQFFTRFQTIGQVRDLEYTMVRKDGTTFPVLASGSAIRDAAGKYVMSRSTVYDISARKREEQARAQLAAIVEYSDDAIISKTLDGRILTWNKGAERIFGFSAEEMVGQCIEKIVPPERLEELHQTMQKLRLGENTNHPETVRRTKDGRLIDIALTISPIKDATGKTVAAAVVSRDISDRIRAENEIRQLAQRQAVVAELGQQMLRHDPVEKILDMAVASAAKTLDVEYCTVLELLAGDRELLLRSGVGWKEGLVGHATVGNGLDSQAGFTLMSKGPVVVEDLRHETRFHSPPLLHDHLVVSGMSVIIPTSSGPWGVMGAHTRQRRSFTRDEVNFLQAIANLLGLMIERRRAEEEILRVNRALHALSSCNETLIRATNESKLPEDICRIVADQAGYRFCWVGQAEHDETKTVKPLAWAGYEDGYLKIANVTWADSERGRGPTGTCIRTLQTQVVKNYADPSVAPWRDEALKRGYQSSVAVPIVLDSDVFGALTIYSRAPDAFGAEEVKLLNELAADLGFGIGAIRTREEIRKLNSELEQRVMARTAELHAANQAVEQAREREIEIGFRIQQTLLLDQPPVDVPGLRVAALTIPSQRIDGDFYIFIRNSDDCLDVIVGDVMGKGIPAALLGAATKSHFQKALGDLMGQCTKGELPEPREIVMLAHAELVGHLIALDSFVTLVYARFDVRKRCLSLVDCGHTGTVHLHGKTGVCEVVHGDNLPLGVREGEIYDQISVPFEPGDLLLFFSDGITEARNPAGQLFGEKLLEECVTSNAALEPAALVEAVRKTVFTFSGSNNLNDDLTTVAVRVEERQYPMAQAEIEIASDLRNLRRARDFVREFCRDLLDEDGAGQLDLAVNEAVSNIMKHAYHGRSDQQIHVEAEAFPGHVAIRLHHLGDPFKPSTAPPPALDGSRESGFGAYIITKCVDEVRYYRDERGRNCIALVKARK